MPFGFMFVLCLIPCVGRPSARWESGEYWFLDFHYSHGPNFLLRTRRSMREPRPQQSVQPRPNQRAANGHDHHGDAIAYQREEWSRTSTRKRPAQAEDRAPNCVANAALQVLGRNRDRRARDALQPKPLD